MRLLNSESLVLEYHIDDRIPEYAILSHRWVDREVSLQEWLKPDDGTKSKPGYHKITATCRQALEDGIKHVWVDTCCIDKTSSAELSEAINAMFDWYQQAKVCYVFMDDVDNSAGPPADETVEQFAQSKWFTRGWTLQELIAPREVRFYDKSWTLFGTKSSWARLIRHITGIDQRVLDGSKDFRDFSVACRMSWASCRETTRLEDIAYCLMGIFEVNMPMLYGERNRAFIRLREEIIRSSDDHSIYAWSDPEASLHDEYGLLAEHPRCFKDSSDFHPATGIRPELRLITQTSSGISIHVPAVLDQTHTKGVLSCCFGSKSTSRVGIYLRCVDMVGCQFRRIKAKTLESISRHPTLSRQIFVKQRKCLIRANAPQPSLDTVKLVYHENASWGMGPWNRKAWVSPHSFLTESWRLPTAEQMYNAAETWRLVVERSPNTYENLRRCVVALPPFPNTPAFLVSFGPGGSNQENLVNQDLLVGRASNGHVGVKAASTALTSMVNKDENFHFDSYATDLNPLEPSSGAHIVDFDLGGRIAIALTRREVDGHSEYDLLFAQIKMPDDDQFVKMAKAER